MAKFSLTVGSDDSRDIALVSVLIDILLHGKDATIDSEIFLESIRALDFQMGAFLNGGNVYMHNAFPPLPEIIDALHQLAKTIEIAGNVQSSE